MKWCSEVPRVCRQTVVTGCFSSWIHPGFIQCVPENPPLIRCIDIRSSSKKKVNGVQVFITSSCKERNLAFLAFQPRSRCCFGGLFILQVQFCKHIWLRLTLDQQIRCWREHPAIGSLQRYAHSAQHTAKPSGADCQKRPPLEVNHQHLHRSLWRLICNPFQQVSQLTHLALIFGEEINAFRTRISMRFG